MRFWNEPTTKDAFYLGLISTILEFIFCIAAIVWYFLHGSNLVLVFGLENFVDWFSSVVVLWRFFAPGEMTKEREMILQRREMRASVAISLVMILMGVGVIATSSYDIAMGPETTVETDFVIYVLSCISVLIFGWLCLVKFRYASLLDSESLYKDGLCSLIGTILSAALFINAFLVRAFPGLWWLDPFIAIVCGIAALVYGVYSVFAAWKFQGIPVCSLSWWFMSRGDADSTNNKDDDDDSGKAGIAIPDREMTKSTKSTTNLSSEVV